MYNFLHPDSQSQAWPLFLNSEISIVGACAHVRVGVCPCVLCGLHVLCLCGVCTCCVCDVCVCDDQSSADV